MLKLLTCLEAELGIVFLCLTTLMRRCLLDHYINLTSDFCMRLTSIFQSQVDEEGAWVSRV